MSFFREAQRHYEWKLATQFSGTVPVQDSAGEKLDTTTTSGSPVPRTAQMEGAWYYYDGLNYDGVRWLLIPPASVTPMSPAYEPSPPDAEALRFAELSKPLPTPAEVLHELEGTP